MNSDPSVGAAAADIDFAATRSTPQVRTDWSEGVLMMSGESYPENTYEIFDGIISWVERFLAETDRELRLDLRLSYLNTSSIRAMIDIFDRLQAAHDGGRALSVLWLYDSRNPRAAELGEEFKEDYTFGFLIQPLEV